MEPAENTVLDLVECCMTDDVANFTWMVRTSGSNIIDLDIPIMTYLIGSNTPVVLLRTPLMIAAMYRSPEVMAFILHSGLVDVDKPSPSDGATAIDCAYNAVSSSSIIGMLLTARAQREQPGNLDQNSGNCESEGPKFMMFTYKVESCKKGCKVDSYGKCPYLHDPKENGRRDLRKHFYQAENCPYYDAYKSCSKGIQCLFSHGRKEKLYHPFLYRTRDCQNGTLCKQLFCPHAHNAEQKRIPDPHAQLEEEKRKVLNRTRATNIDANNTTAPGPSHGQGGSTSSATPGNAFVNNDEDDWLSLMDDISLALKNMMDSSGAN